MSAFLLFKGFLLGFCISMPIGPIGILCLRYNLLEGALAGFCAGLGASIADMVYASFAAFGLRFIINAVQTYEHVVRFLAGLFLIGLSTLLFRSKRQAIEDSTQMPPAQSLLLIFFTTFLVTLSNPAAILLFMTLFAALDIGDMIQSPLHGITLMSAILGGSVMAWLLLAVGIGWFRDRIDRSFVWRINHYAGWAIAVIGGLTILSLLFSWYC